MLKTTQNSKKAKNPKFNNYKAFSQAVKLILICINLYYKHTKVITHFKLAISLNEKITPYSRRI